MNPKLVFVETIDDLLDFRSWLGERRPWLAVDTETTGLDWWEPHFVRLVQFGDANTGWALPYYWWQRVIHDSLNDYQGRIVAQNAKFEYHGLHPEHFSERWHDSKIMAWLDDSSRRTALKSLAPALVDPRAAQGERVLKSAMRKQGWTWDTVPVDFVPYWAYGALDTILTARIAEYFEPRIDMALHDEEFEVQRVIANAEEAGLYHDIEYNNDLWEAYSDEMKELSFQLSEGFGLRSPNSSEQLAIALQEAGWKPRNFTPTGMIAVSEKEFADFDHPLTHRVIRYKRLRKWKKAYLENFAKMCDENDRLHPSVNTLEARTGRMSVTNPALQTLPRGPEIRNCFRAPEGHKLIAIDYSQIEMRIMAHYSEDPLLIETILEGGDLHDATASALFGSDFTTAQRSISKNANFAKIYCSGVSKFSETAGVPIGDAKAVFERYSDSYPAVQTFIERVIDSGKSRLYHEGQSYAFTHGNRRLPADDDKPYALVNYIIQGTAAEVMKQSLLRLDAAGFGEYIRLPIHDEVLFEVPEENAERLYPELVDAMQDLNTFKVPLTVDGAIGDRWGDLK